MKVELTEDQARALSDWAEEGYRENGTTAWGPRFDAAMVVAQAVNRKLWTPCSPGCPGVAVFDGNFVEPEGFVHIERCDACDRFPDDQTAAESLVAKKMDVLHICVDCPEDEQRPMGITEAKHHFSENHNRQRVIIREELAEHALELGKLNEWRPTG